MHACMRALNHIQGPEAESVSAGDVCRVAGATSSIVRPANMTLLPSFFF